jgi:hypothetical protein
MTLKEKIQKEPVVVYKDGFTLTNQSAEHLEQIADDFAIGFADWFHANCYEDQVGYYTASELLETYKKEKGL